MSTVELTPYQKDALEFFINSKDKRVLYGLPTGTGKTVIGLSLIKYVKEKEPLAKILVISPANLKPNFYDTNIQQKWGLPLHVVMSEKDFLYAIKNNLIPIISYHFLGRNYGKIIKLTKGFDFVLFDEVHYAKNNNTTFSLGTEIICQNSKYVTIFTASYVANRIQEFLKLLSYVVPAHLREELKKIKDIETLKEYKSILQNYVFIIPQKEVQKVIKVPKVKFINLKVTLSKEETKVYNLFHKQLPDSLKKQIIKDITKIDIKEFPKNFLIAMEQFLLFPSYLSKYGEIIDKSIEDKPGSKVNAFIEIVKSSPNVKRIVFVPFVEWGGIKLQKILNENGIKNVLYHGELSLEERQELIKLYNESKEVNTFILTLAGKEGINLPVTEEVHFLGYTWNPEDMIQIIGRATRMTSKVEVVKVFLYEAIKYTNLLDKITLKTIPSNKPIKKSLLTIDGMILLALKSKIQIKTDITAIFGRKIKLDDLYETMTMGNIAAGGGYYETPSGQNPILTIFYPVVYDDHIDYGGV